MADKKNIWFVSTMNASSWGGSEELWAGAALDLARDGYRIAASVQGWSPPHEKVVGLAKAGVNVQLRRSNIPFVLRAWRKSVRRNQQTIDYDLAKFLDSGTPTLVAICNGGAAPPVEILQACVARGLPFATVGQSHSEHFWPDDAAAEQYRKLMPMARKCFFVSNANLKLFEKQIGMDLPNAEIVWNPFNVAFDADPPWPSVDEAEELRLACVGRLHPPSKGQDILLEALADAAWRDRGWHLTFYGDGPMRDGIGRMIERHGLRGRVEVAGFFASVEAIWSNNHVLLMPSRYEGLPLAIVEAMLCSRPVVATDVAGHSEVLQDGLTGFIADAPTPKSFGEALERLWLRRKELKMMGEVSARMIRKRIPADPMRSFAEKIKSLAEAD
jgi:glycosyltransferase involved in cell wall biosynthesis